MTTRDEAKQGGKDRDDDVSAGEAEGAPDSADVRAGEQAFGVVGIGASAGGLESLEQVLRVIPRDTELAIVVVQHLDPAHESHLAEILDRSTAMPVVTATQGCPLEPGHIYVMPPGVTMLVMDGRLALEARSLRGQNMPIDLFLRSLALERHARSVGVVLSGTGSDGALGVKAIKAEGGITLAESDETASQSAMPRSAVSTGCVDFVLPAEAIGREIATLGPRLHAAYTDAEREAGAAEHAALRRILALVRVAKGVDFSLYRHTTIRRRIIRRMLLHKLSSETEYLRLLQTHPAEMDALYQDVLIRVTSFFRDPSVHQALKESVFPALLHDRLQDHPIRIWVPGCATGEEAYSLAIGLVEQLQELKANVPIQVFATDVNEEALERARAGVYVQNIALDVSPERLRRFFSKAGKSYQISKSIRDMCIFARQDLTTDPPFSRLDLISCRNVLIYVEPQLQRRVLHIFHYALKPSGFLVLGHSESISTAGELFRVVDRRHKIFARMSVAPPLIVDFPATLHAAAGGAPQKLAVRAPLETETQVLQHEADRLVLARYAPAGVIINQDMHVVQFRGQTGQYLEPAPGEPTFNLLKLARSPLPMEIRTAVHKAQKSGEPVRSAPVQVRADGSVRTMTVAVLPLRTQAREERAVPGGQHFLVLFEDQPAEQPAGAGEGRRTRKGAEPRLSPTERRELTRLKQELNANREHMQAIIEEREAFNEELQSANEEILSSNEELQSMNEELETAKEELQSTNEELTTLNEELRNRNLELSQVNNDLTNTLSSVNLPIVMLGTDLRIRRFTSMAERVLNLIPTDVGRPLGDIRPRIQVDDLEARIAEVIDTMRTFEAEVRDRDGRWYSLRIRPYRTSDNKIDGAVLTLIDIDDSKRVQQERHGAGEYADALLELAHEPLCVLDAALRVKSGNAAFFELVRTTPEAARGTSFHELDRGRWSVRSLRALLEEILEKDTAIRGYVIEQELPGGERRTIRLNARQIPRATGEAAELILIAFEEVKAHS